MSESPPADNSFNKMAGTPLVITHTTKDGKGTETKTSYELKPIPLRIWGKFYNWVALRPYFQALEAGVEKAELKEVLAECSNNHLSMYSPEVTLALMSGDGILKFVSLSLQYGYPSLTDTFVRQLIDDCEDQITALMKELFSVNGLEIKTKENPEGNESPPNP